MTNEQEPEQGTLDRAIWRGNNLIKQGADANEDEETQLSDVLADLMHWANHEHVDFDAALAHAQRSRLDELEEWRAVEVRISNGYEDGHESEVDVWVNGPDEDDDDLDEWWQTEVFEHTGDGHGDGTKLGSYYEARILSTSPADMELLGKTNEWSD